MNILLINHYAGSVHHGMEFRPYYLAREWVRSGHRVRILAASHSHVRHHHPVLGGRSRADETIDGIEYTWFSTPPYQGNGLARVRNMAAFVVRLFRESRSIARLFRPDVVIASSTYPLDIFPASRIARLAKARLLFEVHDLWPLSPMELGGYRWWHPFIVLLQLAENYACRHADAIVSMLPKVAAHLEAHGMAPHKLHIVPNGADPTEWGPDTPAVPDALTGCLTRWRDAGTFIVGYAGGHGTANALSYLLDAARLLRDHPVVFVLVGTGPDKALLQQRALALGLSNVHFFDAIAKVQIPAFLRAIDLAYIGWQRQPLYRFGIAPNKLIDYMMAGRPILHAVDAGNDLVADAQCGLTVMPESPRAVADGIQSLMRLDPETRAAMGQRGRQFALDQLSYPVLSRRFLHIFLGEKAMDDHLDAPAITPFLPFALPDIGEEEISAVVECMRSGWVTTGPVSKQFEQAFSAYLVDGGESIAVNSATAGLHLALEALGIGPGDEVIVPSLTFTATAEVVRYLGAQPVFVDVDPATLNISPTAIEAAIGPRTRAVIPVHYAGLACDMDAILALAARYHLRVIEDAAHAFPTRYRGRLIGTLPSDVVVFSFYANKTMTTGEGGMVVTRDPIVAKRIRLMRIHGISSDAFNRYISKTPGWYYEVVAAGFKYNLTDIAASIGIAQLRKIDRFLLRREELAARYDNALSGFPLILPPRPQPGSNHAWHLYVIRLTKTAKMGRDDLIARLAQRGIGTSVHFIPLHRQPYWRDAYSLHDAQFPATEQAYQSMLTLPLYTRMTDGDQQRVIDEIGTALS